MFREIFRPQTLEEALWLLADDQPRNIPLGAGTNLIPEVVGELAAIDLSALGLDQIDSHGNGLHLGSMPEPVLAFDGPSASGLAEAAFDRFCNLRVGAQAVEESKAVSQLALDCLETLQHQREKENG